MSKIIAKGKENVNYSDEMREKMQPLIDRDYMVNKATCSSCGSIFKYGADETYRESRNDMYKITCPNCGKINNVPEPKSMAMEELTQEEYIKYTTEIRKSQTLHSIAVSTAIILVTGTLTLFHYLILL